MSGFEDALDVVVHLLVSHKEQVIAQNSPCPVLLPGLVAQVLGGQRSKAAGKFGTVVNRGPYR